MAVKTWLLQHPLQFSGDLLGTLATTLHVFTGCQVGILQQPLLLLLLQGQLCPLAVGDVFTFGASTRSYSVQMPTATDALCEKSVTKKRSRVTFAEDGAVNCDLDTAVAAGGDGSHKTKKFGQVWMKGVRGRSCQQP